MNMVERWRQRTDYGPVVVVSQDGIGRSGVYCAANACIEQVIQHGEVSLKKLQGVQNFLEGGRWVVVNENEAHELDKNKYKYK